MADPNELLCVGDMASEAKLRPETIQKKCAAGEIPGAFHLGGLLQGPWRIRRREFEKWLGETDTPKTP